MSTKRHYWAQLKFLFSWVVSKVCTANRTELNWNAGSVTSHSVNELALCRVQFWFISFALYISSLRFSASLKQWVLPKSVLKIQMHESCISLVTLMSVHISRWNWCTVTYYKSLKCTEMERMMSRCQKLSFSVLSCHSFFEWCSVSSFTNASHRNLYIVQKCRP